MEQRAKDIFAQPLTQLRRPDLPRLLRQPRTNLSFPAPQLIPTAQSLLTGLGMPLDGRSGLNVHAITLGRKNPRPLCLAVNPPNDVRLSVRPVAGAEPLRLLLYESMQALMYTAPPADPWELRALGDSAATRAVAMAASSLVDQAELLRTTGHMKEAEVTGYLQNAAARRLFAVRHTAAQVLLETHLRQNGSSPADTWRQQASRAYGFELSAAEGERWVLEDSGLMSSAQTLLATLLSAQLERHLVAKHGARWWQSESAGKFLSELMARGGALSLAEVARAGDENSVSPTALVQVIEGSLAPR